MVENPTTEQDQTEEQPKKETELKTLYEDKGLQQQSFKEYMELKKRQEERKKFQLPAPIKYILATPVILLFCLGLIFIPFMIYLFFTS